MNHQEVIKELEQYINKEKAAFYPLFFKTEKGRYSEGDIFLGITVPNQRIVAKKFRELSLQEIQKLLESKYHEHRLTGWIILTYAYEKGDEAKKKEIYTFSLQNTLYMNNWDLVDLAAPKIVGAYMLDHHGERKVLKKLMKSSIWWERRIAMIASFPIIKKGDFADALTIAEELVYDEHDLIRKAVGWMLREIGNVDRRVEETFLKKYYKTMPRVMLRYAIEKFDKEKRAFYMGKH